MKTKTINLSRFGQYKITQVQYLEKLYKKLGKSYDLEDLFSKSRGELYHLAAEARKEISLRKKGRI